jgi:hypothetical protein
MWWPKVTTYFLYAISKIIWHFFGIFGRNYLEIYRKFSSFLVQTNFCGIQSWKYWELLLSLYLNMSSFCFFALVYTLNDNFCNETTVWKYSIEALFYQEFKKFLPPKLAKLVNRPIHHVKFISLNSRKKIFLSMC